MDAKKKEKFSFSPRNAFSLLDRLRTRRVRIVLGAAIVLIVVGAVYNKVSDYAQSQEYMEEDQLTATTSVQSEVGADAKAIEQNQVAGQKQVAAVETSVTKTDAQVVQVKASENTTKKDIQKLMTAVNAVQSTNTAMQSQMGAIQNEVASLKAQPSTTQTVQLDAGNLPFTVVSIEPWNGVWVVGVQSNMGTQLYSLNQTVMGWMVKSIDTTLPAVTFANSANPNQTIVVSLAPGAASSASPASVSGAVNSSSGTVVDPDNDSTSIYPIQGGQQ